MSNNINTNSFLFEKIFHVQTNEPLTLYPVIKNEGEIQPVISLIKNEKNISALEKYNKIMELYSLFKLNKNLLPLFMDNCTIKNCNCLFELIFEVYLNNDIQNDKLIKLEEFLHFLLINITLNKNSLEYIYQKLSKFFNKNNKENLNEGLLLKYLNLLNLCYKNHLNPEDYKIDELNNSKDIKEINNYFYFSGHGSSFSFTLNHSSANPNTDFPTLEQGCSFVFWINLDKNLLNNFFQIYIEKHIQINLISLNIGGHKIKLILKENISFQILVDETESNPCDLNSIYTFNEWRNICFTIGKENNQESVVKIFIDGKEIQKLSLPKNFPVAEKINTINLFQNLIGRVSSFMFFSYTIEPKLINYFSSFEKGGFYNNKILFKFLHLNDTNYFDNSINYKYYDRVKNDKTEEKMLNIKSEEHNIKNIISVFCPFTYDKNFHRIDDIFGNFIVILSKNSGATNYINNYKNIRFCGGITNLLPIAELLLSYKNKSQRKILTENILMKYFNIIKSIIIGNSNNYLDASQNNFFSCLGLFLEKYPSNIFSEKILDILLELGKEDFKNTDFNVSNFVNMILLNEKIFSKFNTENQVKLWEEVYKFFTSDDTLIKDSFNMSKICLLLRFYDEKRYEEFCCQKHANIIKSKKAVKIMNPEMNSKTQQLFKLIQLYIKNFSRDIDSTNLFKLLSLDLSPCLQIKIIQTYKNFFDDQKIVTEEKETMLNNLLLNNFFEISEYVLTVSLLDVRIAILNLFKILLNDFNKLIQNFLTEKSQSLKSIFIYTSYNLLPDDLLIEIDNPKKSKDDKELVPNRKYTFQNSKIKRRKSSPSFENNYKENKRYSIHIRNFLEKETEKFPLIKYINKEYYDSETKQLWRLFSEWALCIIGVEQNERGQNLPKLKINDYVIDFCIVFTSKENNHAYIDNFISCLYAYLTDSNIINKDVLFKNNDLYKYIIDIIFNYHILENNSNKNDTNENDFIIDNINEKALEILCIFLKNKFEFEERIQYILNYSIYLKKKCELEKKNYNQEKITTITSYLLLKALEFSEENIYFTTKICFQFLVYYKNNEVGLTDKEINNNFEKSGSIFDWLESPIYQKQNEKLPDFIVIPGRNTVMNLNINNNDNKENRRTSIDYSDSKELIPKTLLDGLHYFKEEEDINIIKEEESEDLADNQFNTIKSCEITTNIDISNKTKNNKTLKEIWKDYPIFDYIIDYFFSNLFSLKNLCNKINIEYDNQPLSLYKKLYTEYFKGKNSKNILEKEFLKCVNICVNVPDNNPNNKTNDQSDIENIKKNIINDNNISPKLKSRNINKNKKEKKDINILNINLILLAIAIEITKDQEQKDYLENQLQQLLIFCILTSINVKPTNKYYESIQNELYNMLAYGCLYLKKKNEDKYNQIINYLINPIFIEINQKLNKKGFRKLLKIPKKILHQNTAMFKLFGSNDLSKNEDDDDDEKEEDDDKFQNTRHNIKSLNNSFGRYNSCSNLSNLVIKNKFSSLKKRGSEEKISCISKETDPQEDLSDINKSVNNQISINFNVDKGKAINNIFKETLKIYKKIFKDNLANFKKIKFYYKNKEIDAPAIKEKYKIFGVIKKIIPEFVEKIKKYSNTSNIKEKNRRNIYKTCKNQLFSWKGFWSNKYLFFEHPEFLKLKIKNHYTKEMIKPLLSPILDINYYLPKFKNFNKENLFNKDNYDYYINLDIDSILKNETKIMVTNNTVIFSKKKMIKTHNDELKFVKNSYGFNYLECLYKLTDEDIWDQYNELFEQKLNFNKIANKKKVTTLNSTNSLNKKNDKTNINNKAISEHLLKCCIVKTTNHIKGHLYTKKDYFVFIYDAENINSKKNISGHLFALEDLENDISYDRDMDCCFGSIFKKHKKDKDIINLVIKYEEIKFIFIKKYYFRETAAEIFTDNNKSYYFNFSTNEDLLIFIEDIVHTHNPNNTLKFRQIKSKVHNESKKIIGYEKLLPTMKNKTYYISYKMEDWQNYNISTLEYLMWLNIYSGRSFNDLTQYPILPWVFTNYECENIENNKENYRNLSLPIGMLEVDPKSESRRENFIEYYESLKNELKESHPDFDYQYYLAKGDEYLTNYNKKKLKAAKKLKNNENMEQDESEFSLIQYNQIPYNYGTHYSNPTYVSLYLLRIFPFSNTCIEIHGDKFDDPERVFCSMSKAFTSVSTLKDDLRELTPEFFTLPDIFQNKNNFNISQNKLDSEGKEIIINDVELPKWSENNPCNFVVKMRNYLESQEININKWIDLIFGCYQKGENAEKINNIFMAHTYEKIVKIHEINDIDTRNALMRLFETGATPHQIFEFDSKPRVEKNVFLQKNSNYNNSKLKFLYENQTLNVIYLNIPKYKDMLIYKNKTLTESKDYEQIIYPQILNIKFVDNENLKLLTHTNHLINIKLTKDEKGIIIDEKNSQHNFYDNASYKYACSYKISEITTPIIIYEKNRLILKGGFWDGRIEINSITSDQKEEPISSVIFPDPFINNIIIMEMSQDEKLLLCGTKEGIIIAFEVDKTKLKVLKKLILHSDEITSISMNNVLNMFATASMDGYINLHILPSFKLVRSIYITNDDIDYAKNVFLSSDPLASLVIYIEKQNLFRSYTINGEKICEIKEDGKNIKICCSVVFKSLDFLDYLIYGTSNGFIKIRSFPYMNLINSIKVFEGRTVYSLTISNDKRCCYAWGTGEQIAIIKGSTCANNQEKEKEKENE